MTEPVFDGDEELGTEEEGQMVAYAHRDIKPGYVQNTRATLMSET
jgi:hypothetical protein